jgi:hypothetical protein
MGLAAGAAVDVPDDDSRLFLRRGIYRYGKNMSQFVLPLLSCFIASTQSTSVLQCGVERRKNPSMPLPGLAGLRELIRRPAGRMAGRMAVGHFILILIGCGH